MKRATWNSSGSGLTRKAPYFESDSSNSDYGDENDENDQQEISVSSRGRIRKISSKVRGYFQ